MKLIKLSANKESFKTIHFNPHGLSLVIGSSGNDLIDEGTSNGVGKSLTLRLIHFCLASRKDKNLANELPEWIFTLDFSVNGINHNIQRATDDSKIYLDGELIKYAGLTRWLDSCGVFNIGSDSSGLSFRALIKRFARASRHDCDFPLATKSEQPAFSQIVSLFLLGLDTKLAIRKLTLRKKYLKVESAKNAWKTNETLRDLFSTGQDATTRKKWLDQTIPIMEKQLDDMVVSENFSNVEKTIQEQTNTLIELRKRTELEHFKENSIITQLNQNQDLTKQELLELYSGLEDIFKREALRHFEEVEDFHTNLENARNRRLAEDLVSVRTAARQFEQQATKVGEYRDGLLKSIKGKTAFDEYRIIANESAKRQQELKSIEAFLNVESDLEKQRRDVRDNLFNDVKEVDRYLEIKPETYINDRYMTLTQKLYPHSASAIAIKNNEGDNQVRFDLDVYLEASGSDGVSDAKILCFDWLIFSLGANNSMNFLWHDNRLFANIDAGVRAKWFNLVIIELDNSNKQYIATLNAENYEAMKSLLSPEEQTILDNAIILRLSGDKPENKLLGIQVDLPRD